MEEEGKEMQNCGCECENCMKGDHEHCTTGMCKFKKTDDDGEGM
jgi:hypothetical protein